ncbi:hypothetical protein LUZ60_010336 [Juncus effusus]|nr:hypothetical protein LUZ60_010336 [Juncus effusus]
MEQIPIISGEAVGLSIDKSAIQNSKFNSRNKMPENGADLFERFTLDEDSYWYGLNKGLCSSNDSNDENTPDSNLSPNSDANLGKYSEILMSDLIEFFSDAKEDLNKLKSNLKEEMEGVKTLNSEENREIDHKLSNLEKSFELGFVKIHDWFELLKAPIYDLNLVHELQGEIDNLTIKDCIRGIKDEFEAKLCKQKSVLKALNIHWQEKVSELDLMRKELTEFLKTLPRQENNNNLKHANSDGLIISKFKDNIRMGTLEDLLLHEKEEINGSEFENSNWIIKPENRDFSHCKSMSKEEMIHYFKSEMINMKRQYDLALQEKTEELFRYKREIPKGLLFFKKDKEFDSLRKKITDIIAKLDEIRSKKIEVFVVSTDRDEISRLKSKVDSLYYENQALKKLVLDKNKEVKQISCQLRDQNIKMSAQLRKIEKMKDEFEEMELEFNIRDETYSTILRKVVDEFGKKMEGLDDKCKGVLANCQKDRASLEKIILEKDKALSLANEENRKLKGAISYFLTSKDENEKSLRNKFENNLGICENEASGSGDNLGCIIMSIMDLSKKFSETETKLSNNISKSHKRLEALSNECDPLVQNAILMKKNGILHKEMLDISHSELQNTQNEVNMLGKEIDGLLMLLEKIYVTLSHYSPVLQQHPGVIFFFSFPFSFLNIFPFVN